MLPGHRGLILASLAVAILCVASGLEWRARRAQAAVLRADPESILADPALRRTALAGGKRVYLSYCASCHGDTGRGDIQRGAPDLGDADHLYGEGSVAQTQEIVRFGIRAYNTRGWNLATMPAYASAVPYAAERLPPQTPAQIEELTQLLLSFTGRATDAAAAARGRETYETAGCWDCHGHAAEGDPGIGAPRLTDGIWLYGGSHSEIYRSIARGRAGYSPAFGNVLSAAQLRDVAVYVASLAAPQRTADAKP